MAPNIHNRKQAPLVTEVHFTHRVALYFLVFKVNSSSSILSFLEICFNMDIISLPGEGLERKSPLVSLAAPPPSREAVD
jgi:hypothetical protein